MDKSLNFVIIGAQKSGTSFLHNCLIDHPEISMPSGELVIFEHPSYSKNAIRVLEEKLAKSGGGPVRGIKRPSYLAKHESPGLIHSYNKDCKIIVVLRNPVKRAYSAYFHLMKMGLSPIIEPNRGLLQIIRDSQLDNYPRTGEILPFGLYSECLERYLEIFLGKNIHVMWFDDLKKDKLAFVRSAYSFLGVDDTYLSKNINARPQQSIYSLSRLRFRSLYLKLLYQYADDKTGLMARETNFFQRLIIALMGKIDRWIFRLILGDSHKKMSDILKNKLSKYYQNDINKLEKLMKKDLTHWKSE